jgi:hypothetical protein
MTFTFRPAVRKNVPLMISVAGGTGSGKTFSALRIAKGLSRGKRFAGIDSENGRMKHYADMFEFDHGDLRAPFRPKCYAEAILAADAAGYPVIVVDSASHEHAGDGGLLDMHEAELDRMAGDDWKKREACKMAAWINPKMEHKDFVSKLLQIKAHLILCFRAEAKVEMAREKQDNGRDKTVIRPKESIVGAEGWIPVAEKTLPYEMTISFLLRAEHPGVPIPIKLQEQHRKLIALDKPLSEATGEALAAWSEGDKKAAPQEPSKELGVVLELIKRATTSVELEGVATMAQALGANDKALAKDHYRLRSAELKKEGV